jgi:hypothetical protein
MNAMRGVGAALGMLLAATGGALAAGGGSWSLKEFRTPQYTLYMESETAAEVLVEKLTALDRLLDKLVAHDPEVSNIPTTIYVVPHEHWKQSPLFECCLSTLVTSRFSNFLLIDGWQKGAGLRNSAYLQYTGVYLRSKFPGRYPYWYEIGLSDFMFTASIGRDGASIGFHPYENFIGPTVIYSDQASRVRIPIDKALGLEYWSPGYATLPNTDVIDFQFWALVHRSLFEPEFGARTAAYLAQIDRLRPMARAIEAGFGVNPTQLDQEMALYERRREFKWRRVTFDPAPTVKLSPVRNVNEAEALALLAGAVLERDQDHENVDKLIRAAKLKSASPTTIELLQLRRAAIDRDDASLTSSLAALESSLSNTEVARNVALALMERLHEDKPTSAPDSPEIYRLRELSFGLLEQSLKSRPQDPEAAWAFALLAAHLKRDLDSAATRLVAARTQMPRHPDLAAAAALLAEARNETSSVTPNLVEVLRFSRRKEQREWAAQKVDEYHGILK